MQENMVWVTLHNHPKACALITGRPAVQKGVIVYPCLVNGADVMVPAENIRKRRGQ